MPVFSTQEITTSGLRLIASASSSNQIVFVDAKSAATVPADLEDASLYTGKAGTIDAAASTDTTARIVACFTNLDAGMIQVPQPVKAICIRAKLASQQDSAAVVFAACADASSQISIPTRTDPSQRIRFAFNVTFDGSSPLSVTEAGSALMSDLERFVSAHSAGNPAVGDAQDIYGAKTFRGIVNTESQLNANAGASISGTALTITTTSAQVNAPVVFNDTTAAVTTTVYGTLRVYGNISLATTSIPGMSSTGVMHCSSVNATEMGSGIAGGVAEQPITVRGGFKPTVFSGTSSPFNLGSSSAAWNALYTQHAQINAWIHIPTGVSFTRATVGNEGQNPSISAGQLLFSNAPTDGVVLSTQALNGDTFSLDIRRVSQAIESDVDHSVSVPIGALVLSIPPDSWLTTIRNRIRAGETIVVGRDEFYVAEYTPGNMSSATDWEKAAHYEPSVYGPNPGEYCYLAAGTYRVLCSVLENTSMSQGSRVLNGSPLILQRIS